MNERELFLSALELDDPTARAAHLQAACAGDADLLARVKALLASHEGQSRFLNTPVAEQLGGDSPAGTAATLLVGQGKHEEPASDEVSLEYLQPATRPDSLGRLSHYEVLEVLGHGAFGTVLKAFDEKLQRVVAIKVLAPQLAATSPARKRFLREARASAAIRHENVVSIHAVDDNPLPYLVMEFIPGRTLQQRLDKQGPLDVQDVLRLGKQIAYGLAAAHARDLIHRDVKPGNILLDTSVNDQVKITDFGLARAADDASVTQSGMIAGTPLYMAPEQALGKQLDQRADLFSLGSVLYQMVSGRPPFRAPTTLAVMKRVAEDTPRPIQEIIPETPAWLCAIISKLHAKDPGERYSSAKEVGDLLDHCLAEVQQGRIPQVAVAEPPREPVSLPPPKPAPAVAQNRSRQPLMTAAAVALILLIFLGISEATGVTKLAATVIRITTGSGTLVIETDDPGVSVSINGEELVIIGGGIQELRLKPGQHKLLASKNGQVVSQELVTITRGGRQVVRVSKESQSARVRVSTDHDRRAAEWVLSIGGNVRIVQDDHARWAPTLADLPAGPWKLIGVSLALADRKASKSGLDNLAGCTNLQILHLHGVQLTQAGLERLREYPALVELDLSRVPVTDADLAKLTGLEQMAFLTLSHTQVTDNGLAHLKAFKNLRQLALEGTSVTDAGLPHLAGLKHLDHLHLAGTEVTDAGLQHLQALEVLGHLYLDNTSVGDAGLAHLKPLQQLHLLGLGSTQVTSEGLAHLKNLKALTALGLDSTRVTDADIDALAECAGLRAIYLRKTKVSEAGAKKLAAKLPACRIEYEGGAVEPTATAADPDRRAAEWVLSRGGTVHINDDPNHVLQASDLPSAPFRLTGFHLRKPEVEDVELHILKDCQHLTRIDLAFTGISDTGLDFVAGRGGQLKTLDLSGTNVTDAGLATLAPCNELTELSLGSPLITDVGVAQLGNFQQLTHLWLKGDKLTDAVLQSFKDSQNLTMVDIQWTQIGDAGIAHLHGCKNLTMLWARHSMVTASGVKELQSALPNCKVDSNDTPQDPERRAAEWVLSIGGKIQLVQGSNIVTTKDLPAEPFQISLVSLNESTKVTADGLAHLKNLQHLAYLYLNRSSVADAELAQLASCKKLVVLTLDSTKVSDEGLAVLKNFPDLRHLSLHNTRVSDAGLAHVKACKNLTQQLNLSLTQITDAGLKSLAGLTDLESLELSRTRVSDEGVQKLAASLPRCKITWDGGVIDPMPSSAADRRAAEWVLSMGGRVEVNGVNRVLTKVSDLPAEPFRLTLLDLLDNQKATDAGLANCQGCKNVITLNLTGTPTSDAGLAHFKECKQLQTLSLSGTAVTPVGLKFLEACEELVYFAMGSPNLTDAGLAHLKNCKKLQELDVRYSRLISDAGLAHFKDCHELEALLLDFTQVTDATLALFKDRNLSKWGLIGTRVTDAGLANLENHTNLSALALDGADVTDAGLAHLKNCKRLTHLQLGGARITSAGLAHLKDCNLTTLWVHDTPLTDESVAVISEFYKLRSLTVKGTKITEAGVKKLAAALPLCDIGWNGGAIEPGKENHKSDTP